MARIITTTLCPQCGKHYLRGEFNQELGATYRWCRCGFEDDIQGRVEENEDAE